MTSNSMTVLFREDWSIELPTPMWAELLLFLSKCGWRPSVPTHSFLAGTCVVSENDALSLAKAGEFVLDETAKDPAAALGTMQFDWGKFAEIVGFTAEGSFSIRNGG
jgi:hypothetical protein